MEENPKTGDPEIVICRELEPDDELQTGDEIFCRDSGEFNQTVGHGWFLPRRVGWSTKEWAPDSTFFRTVLRPLSDAEIAEAKIVKFNIGDKVHYIGHFGDRRGISNPDKYFSRDVAYIVQDDFCDEQREWCHVSNDPDHWHCSPDWFELIKEESAKTPATITLHFDDIRDANHFVKYYLDDAIDEVTYGVFHGPPEPWDDIKEIVGDLEINLRRLGK